MTIIYNARLVDETMCTEGALILEGGKIVRVLTGSFLTKEAVMTAAEITDGGDSSSPEPAVFTDAKGMTVAPAFIDMHAHFRYPGQPKKEDLDSALNAAAAGGFGTLVLMPNTYPVVSSKETALKINAEAAERGMSRVIQAVSITSNFDGITKKHLNALDRESVPLISEDGRDVESATVMLDAMTIAAEKGIIAACHCEDRHLAAAAQQYKTHAFENMRRYKISPCGAKEQHPLSAVSEEDISKIRLYIDNMNAVLRLAEDIATERNIAIAQMTGCHVHICHVSTEKSIQAVRRAKAEQAALADSLPDADDISSNSTVRADPSRYSTKFRVTCEVTPHHLALTGTQPPEAFAFVSPPLRSEADRSALIQALRDGTADVIATDHAPHTALDKEYGSPGFSGLESAYALCHTVLVCQEGFSEQKLSSLMSAEPARILRLNKGLLKEGYDADIVLLDPQEQWQVDSAKFFSKGKATPLQGRTLTGRVKALFVGGRRIYSE